MARDDESESMFPDLDPKKPAEAEVIKAAKKYLKLYDKRREDLKDAKAKEDEAHDAMIEAAHAAKVDKFTIAGRIIEIESKEHAKVKAAKIDGDDQGEGDDGDED